MSKKIITGVIIFGMILTMFFWPKKITIRIGIFSGSNWDVPSGDSYHVIDYAIECFEKANPNVEVEYESGILKEDYSLWLSEQIIKGEEPDVYMVISEDFNTLSSLGALKDLGQFIKNDDEFQSDDFYQSALHSGVYQNTQYALPYESNPSLMFVNKTLLKNEGIEMPRNDWTLDDFYNICKQVTKSTRNNDGDNQYGCYAYDWLDSVYGHGEQLFDEEGKECYLSQDSVKDSITFVQKLNELNQGHSITSTEFDKGKVAFSPMPFSQYRTYMPYPWRVKKYSEFEWDCVKMPSLPNKERSSEVSSLLMGVSSRSYHGDIAWEFLKTLTYNQQIQQELFKYSQGISPLKTVTKSEETLALLKEESGNSQVNMSLLNEVMESAISHGQFKKYESTLHLINTRIQQIILNNSDFDIALMQLQKEINQFLKE